MYKFASICTSGGVFEQGLKDYPITPIWGVELNPRVAQVYVDNYPGHKIIVDNCCNVDWSNLERPDFLHASPSCRSFSQLNNKKEAAKDIAVARSVASAIAFYKPEVFTLENVSKYEDSESWTVIESQLNFLGYNISAKIERMKFYGVPQKQRNRFIAIATLNKPSITLIAPNRTNHWYECIQNLTGDLERSDLTNTQLKYLKPKTKRAIMAGETVLIKRNQIRQSTCAAYASEPYCWSPTATLATDQNENERPKFADLITPQGAFRLTVRCLARIQTIDDSYKMPDSVAIAGMVVGDAIPPLFSQIMWGQILERIGVDAIAENIVFPKVRHLKSADSVGYNSDKYRRKNIIIKAQKRGEKTYLRHYFKHEGKLEYIKKAYLDRVLNEVDSGKSDDEVLIFLRYLENYTSRNSGRSSDNPDKDRRKKQRKKGEGGGNICYKPIEKNKRIYHEYWFQYNLGGSNKAKYIPKKKIDLIIKMNGDLLPVKDILKAIRNDKIEE